MIGRRDPRKDREIAAGLGSLAEACRSYRLSRGYTLAELAERSDLDLRHVQTIEASMGNPTLATIIRLARGLGVGPAVLIGGVGSAPVEDAKAASQGARGKELDEEFESGEQPESDAIVAMRVKSLRLRRDWSQAELASRAGISQGAVQAIESRSKSPTLRTLDVIAKALGVLPGGLLEPSREFKMSRARAGRV